MSTKIIGVNEVKKLFEDAGKAPARVLTKATKSAAKQIQATAKDGGWIDDTGDLRKGIVIKAEKAKKGKRVYQVFVDSNPNFVKISKEGERAFYPASMEYGWDKPAKSKEERKKKKAARRKIKGPKDHDHPGFHYMQKAADKHGVSSKRLMIEIMGNELDKLK